MKASIRSIAFALGAAALLAGCVSDEKLVTGAAPTIATPLLARYVAMGNSITAGMQSAGINDSTQRQAYPVLLARMAGVPFTVPSLNKPGCPAPYIAPMGVGGRLGGGGSTDCVLRASFKGLVNNVAVPGEYVGDLTNPAQPGANNALGTFINGGLTETQAMAAVQPTFVSLAAPNNDFLGPVNVGDTTLAPTVTAYMASYNAAIAAIKATNPEGVALIGLGPASIPIIEPGAFLFAAYYQAAQAGQPSPFGKPVDTSCAPQQLTGVPNPFAFNLVSLQVATDASISVIRCTPDAKWVTTTSTAGAMGGNPEYQVFLGRMTTINTQIAAIAQQNGWVYVDPNALFADTPDNVRHCKGLDQAATTQAFLATVVAACPGGGGATAPYFGAMFTFDATHPSLAFHKLMASALATAINAKYSTTITTTAPSSSVVSR